MDEKSVKRKLFPSHDEEETYPTFAKLAKNSEEDDEERLQRYEHVRDDHGRKIVLSKS